MNKTLSTLKKKIGIYPKEIVSPSLRRHILKDSDFPYLISYPRTGSHWLRMMMELYFERPSMSLIFKYYENTNFTCYHRHDEDLKIKDVRRVIYLYRNEMDTVYSQAKFYKIGITEEQKIIEIAKNYNNHLKKWLTEEKFTKQKCILTYENLLQNLPQEFLKVCEFLNEPFDADRINEAAAQVSKQKIKKQVTHDDRVIRLDEQYAVGKKEFLNKYKGILEPIFK